MTAEKQRVIIAVVVEVESPTWLDARYGAFTGVLSALRNAALGDEGMHVPARWLPDGTPVTVSVVAVDDILSLMENRAVVLVPSDSLFE